MWNTPIVRRFLRFAAWAYGRISGWRVEGERPADARYVLIGAHHTTNWDLLAALLVSFTLGIEFHWMGKHTLFKGPLGVLMRWLGGIPINRTQAASVTRQCIREFEANRDLVLAITPEGTRGKVKAWKMGFYHIAAGAQVPVVMGYADYKRKVAGIGPRLVPTGNIESDMRIIREFYDTVAAKYPELAGGVSAAGE